MSITGESAMSEIADSVQEAIEEKSDSSFHSVIAVLVALTATIMAICNIKDGNIVQAMAQAQAKSVDTWAFYQAKSTKQHMAENMGEQLNIQLTTGTFSPAARTLLEGKIKQYEAEAKRYDKEKEDIKKEAEGYQEQYDALNVHDDQFDMAEACFTVASAMYGITALTRKRWLLVFAIVLAGVGTLLGLAGFLGWSFHPDWLAKLLG